MIDEYHHASMENFALVKLVKRLSKKWPDICPRLIISSATLELDSFKDDFPDGKIVEIKTENYPVQTHFLPPLMCGPNYNKYDRMQNAAQTALEISKRIIENDPRMTVVPGLEQSREKQKRQEEKKGKEEQNTPIDTILIFASGQSEINHIIDKLFYDNAPYTKYIQVCPLHSNLSDEEIDMAIGEMSPEDRQKYRVKIIVTTNICESSITLPDVAHVIDTMYEKVYTLDMYDREVLKERLISRASSKQRRGRTGRTCPGHYYPMCSEEEYEYMKEFSQNNIHLIDAYRLVLDFLKNHFYSLQDMISILELPVQKIKKSVGKLIGLEMIKLEEGNKGDKGVEGEGEEEKKDEEIEEDDKDCMICMTDEHDRALGCGHFMCNGCIEQLHQRKCPFCRCPIEKVMTLEEYRLENQDISKCNYIITKLGRPRQTTLCS
jgi:HrpA-like RNA helicase